MKNTYDANLKPKF